LRGEPLLFAGWVNRKQLEVIDYFKEENRVLRDSPTCWRSCQLVVFGYPFEWAAGLTTE
jgi:hypothetical protein